MAPPLGRSTDFNNMYWTSVCNQRQYIVGLFSGAQVEYKPVDLQSYEARSQSEL